MSYYSKTLCRTCIFSFLIIGRLGAAGSCETGYFTNLARERQEEIKKVFNDARLSRATKKDSIAALRKEFEEKYNFISSFTDITEKRADLDFILKTYNELRQDIDTMLEILNSQPSFIFGGLREDAKASALEEFVKDLPSIYNSTETHIRFARFWGKYKNQEAKDLLLTKSSFFSEILLFIESAIKNAKTPETTKLNEIKRIFQGQANLFEMVLADVGFKTNVGFKKA